MPSCIPIYDDEDIADLANTLALVFVSVRNSVNAFLNFSTSFFISSS